MKSLYFLLLAVLPLSVTADVVSRISSESELQNFAKSVNKGDDYMGLTVYLTADLDLDGIDWTPIGTTDHPFCGTFDGLGHWVSNLSVNIDGRETGDVAGLFGCIGMTGSIRRVGVRSGSIHLAAKSSDDSNCYVGGIAGLNSGHIEQCANFATVVGNYTMAFVGGIAGANGNISGGETTAIIEDCYNQGRLFTSTATFSDQNYLGGIVGISDGLVQHVYAAGDMSRAAVVDGIATYGIVAPTPVGTFSSGDMMGFALDGGLNTEGDYSLWQFADGRLPELACFSSPLLIGDVNGDGHVSLADVTALVEIILGHDDVEPYFYRHELADVNGDGKMDVADVEAIVYILVGGRG